MHLIYLIFGLLSTILSIFARHVYYLRLFSLFVSQHFGNNFQTGRSWEAVADVDRIQAGRSTFLSNPGPLEHSNIDLN